VHGTLSVFEFDISCCKLPDAQFGACFSFLHSICSWQKHFITTKVIKIEDLYRYKKTTAKAVVLLCGLR